MILKILQVDPINAKKRTMRNAIDTFKREKYNGIKTMAVFTAENPDSVSIPQDDTFLTVLKKNFITFRVRGHFGNIENPYMVLNISAESASRYCGRFQQTSFVYHNFNDDGSLYGEYWEKRNVNAPYDKKDNPYIKKDESKEWLSHEDAEDSYTIIGSNFRYEIPFSVLNETDDAINENLGRIVESLKKKGCIASKNTLLEFSIHRVGPTPFIYRQWIYKGLINFFQS